MSQNSLAPNSLNTIDDLATAVSGRFGNGTAARGPLVIWSELRRPRRGRRRKTIQEVVSFCCRLVFLSLVIKWASLVGLYSRFREMGSQLEANIYRSQYFVVKKM